MADTMSMGGVEGMQAFLRKMKALDAETPKMIRKSFNGVGLIIIEDARRRAPVKTGKLRRSIRAVSTTYTLRIREGGAAVPYAGFIDYGGTVGRSRNVKRNGVSVHHSARKANTARYFAVRPYLKTGRILYPAFNDNRARILEGVQVVLVTTAKERGLVVE